MKIFNQSICYNTVIFFDMNNLHVWTQWECLVCLLSFTLTDKALLISFFKKRNFWMYAKKLHRRKSRMHHILQGAIILLCFFSLSIFHVPLCKIDVWKKVQFYAILVVCSWHNLICAIFPTQYYWINPKIKLEMECNLF